MEIQNIKKSKKILNKKSAVRGITIYDLKFYNKTLEIKTWTYRAIG